MKRTYFKQYITDLESIYAEGRSQLLKLHKETEEKQQAYERARNNSDLSEPRKQILKLEADEARKEYRRAAETIKNETAKKASALREDLIADNAAYLSLKPDKVTPEVIMLLNSGLMNNNDYAELANTNWNNPTVLRLIANQCQKSEDNSTRAIGYTIGEYVNPNSRPSQFDTAQAILDKAMTINFEGAPKTIERYMSAYDTEIKPTCIHNMEVLDGFKGV